MIIQIKSEDYMRAFGESLGKLLYGGEFIELIGDVGAGKTTFVKGLAVGLGVDEQVQSPSFTINRVYNGRDNIILSHYDFYRLENAGIIENELEEVIKDAKTVVVVEWPGAVKKALPTDRLSISINAQTENSRELTINSGGTISDRLVECIGLL